MNPELKIACTPQAYMNMDSGIRRNFIVLTLPVLLLFGCVDPIPFEAEDEIPKLVVFGSFTQLSKDHEIVIRRTSNFGNIGNTVGGAFIEIVNEDGERAQYIEREEGKYILAAGDMCGEPGKGYKLLISFGLRQFESYWEIMPEPVEIENTKLEVNFRPLLSNSDVVIEQHFIDIFIDTPTKTPMGDPTFFRWQMEEVWTLLDFNCGPFDPSTLCFYNVDNKFNNLNIFNSIDDSKEMLDNYLVYSRFPTPYIEFSELHYFNVNQYSISESTYEYWDRVNIVSNPTGSIFDKLPAAVPGNIYEVNGDLEILGYFEVASISYGQVSISLVELNEYIKFPKECNFLYPPFFQPDYCCYCNLLPNQVPKPDWWGE